MTHIKFDDLSKVYGDEVVAVDDVSLSIDEGEFVTLVGPSGCGKTTTLRMIAGFEDPTAGEIRMRDQEITAAPPFRRDVGMVFQSFALFPHMTVKENIAYGMRVADEGFSESEIDDRVSRMLDLIELPGIQDRMPDQLSGGQQQRVALARALALNPQALLLDEPLASLDEQLRKQMQAELSRIQKELGVTTIFVTHNQEEAMTMSDRIVVMNDGEFEQVGPPETVYDDPDSLFVADFIGKSNIFRGTVTETGVDTAIGELTAPVDEFAAGQSVGLVIRPESIDVTPVDGANATEPATDENVVTGDVNLVQVLGGVVEYRVFTESETEFVVTVPGDVHRANQFTRGDTVRLTFPPDACTVSDTESVVDDTDLGDAETPSERVEHHGD